MRNKWMEPNIKRKWERNSTELRYNTILVLVTTFEVDDITNVEV